MKTLFALALICSIGLGLLQARRQLIRSWFVVGQLQLPLAQRRQEATERRLGPPPPAGQARRLAPLRVLLIDGLRADVARGLPAFSRLCAAGVTLHLDVGFPAVSLPVQHALWTGAWQQQSGIQFVVTGLPRPRLASLPELVTRQGARALAVSEAHREIADSFLFSEVWAPAATQPPLAPAQLTQAALAQAGSDAALVLIHTLAVDAAGHQGGPLAPAYRAAAQRSDLLLEALWQTRRPEWTLAALSDHGHRLLGGHGDVEPAVRFVAACLAGPGLPAGAQAGATIVDLHRIFAERLGLPEVRSSGRTLGQVLAGAPAEDPLAASFSVHALALGLIVGGGLLLGLVRGLRRLAARKRQRHRLNWLLGLPWALAYALLLLSALSGPPSLSAAYVYPSVSPLLLWAGATGTLLLLLQLWGLTRPGGASLGLALTVLSLGLLAPTLGALLLTGFPWLRPALCPWASGWASTLTGLCGVMLCGLALGLALGGQALRSSPRDVGH